MSTDSGLDLFDLNLVRRGRETSHVFLPRPERNPEYVRYRTPGVAGVVYIRQLAFEQMRNIALEAAPNEVIGMLCGRPCTDERGDYTLVIAVERARPGEYVGTPGSVRISAAGRAALKTRAAQRRPGLEDVGWYHSHPHGQPRFSTTDFAEQSTLLAHQVGIVAAVDGFGSGRGGEFGVYLGPTGERLTGTRTSPAFPTTPGDSRNGRDDSPKSTPKVHRQLQTGAAAVMALLVIAVSAYWVREAIKDEPVASNTPAPATDDVKPKPTALTHPRRVVRIPELRRCKVGGRIEFAALVPRTFRHGLAVDTLDRTVAAAEYNVATRRVNIDCRAAGETVVKLRHGVTGSAAAVAISVAAPSPKALP